MSFCNIIFDNPDKIYHTGQTVSGSIELPVAETKTIQCKDSKSAFVQFTKTFMIITRLICKDRGICELQVLDKWSNQHKYCVLCQRKLFR